MHFLFRCGWPEEVSSADLKRSHKLLIFYLGQDKLAFCQSNLLLMQIMDPEMVLKLHLTLNSQGNYFFIERLDMSELLETGNY